MNPKANHGLFQAITGALKPLNEESNGPMSAEEYHKSLTHAADVFVQRRKISNAVTKIMSLHQDRHGLGDDHSNNPHRSEYYQHSGAADEALQLVHDIHAKFKEHHGEAAGSAYDHIDNAEARAK